jgi:hypothetical protein
MRPSTAFLIGAVLALFFALGFLLMPTQVLSVYGVQGDAAVLLMSRFFGLALLQVGVTLWVLKDTRDPGTQRGLALGGAIGAVVGIVVAFMATRVGMLNAMGWSVVAIYALLVFGYVTVLRARPAGA